MGNLFERFSSDSWSDSDDFLEIFSILRQLPEGLYVHSTNFPDHAYYVSRTNSKNKLTITLCSVLSRDQIRPVARISSETDHFNFFPLVSNVRDLLSYFFALCYISSRNLMKLFLRNSCKMHHFNVCTPVSNLRDFLNYFSKHYCQVEQKKMLVYRTSEFSEIFLDTATQICMINYRNYYMENEKYYISRWLTNNYFTLNENKNMHLCLGYRKIIVEPVTLKSHILTHSSFQNCNLLPKNWKEGPLPVSKKACKFEISLEQRKKISVDVTTPDVAICWSLNNGNLFNLLSKSIDKKFFDLRIM